MIRDRNITSIIIIRNMETGGAARRLGVLSPTAVIELGSIWWVIGSQFIVPFLVVVAAANEERRMEAA